MIKVYRSNEIPPKKTTGVTRIELPNDSTPSLSITLTTVMGIYSFTERVLKQQYIQLTILEGIGVLHTEVTVQTLIVGTTVLLVPRESIYHIESTTNITFLEVNSDDKKPESEIKDFKERFPESGFKSYNHETAVIALEGEVFIFGENEWYEILNEWDIVVIPPNTPYYLLSSDSRMVKVQIVQC